MAELAGGVSIVASLIFVGLQLRQEQQISLSEFQYQRIEILNDHRSLIMQHIDIWIAGNSGNELDQSSQEIYEMLIDNEWNRTSALESAGERLDGGSPGGLLSMFAKFLYDNAGAREVWLERDRETDTTRARAGIARSSAASSNSDRVKDFLDIFDSSTD